MDEAKPELIPTRQTLLSRLRDVDNHESWREFFDTYWRLIYNAAIKAGLTDAEAQDVVQETVISVCRNLQNFKYDAEGSFKAWLLKLTRWRIVDQFRKRISKGSKAKAEEADQAELENVPDPGASIPDSFWDEEWERNIFEAAMERTKQRVDPKLFQVFDLYVMKEWPVAKVCEVMDVSAAHVYLAKHRVSKILKKELQTVEKMKLQRK